MIQKKIEIVRTLEHLKHTNPTAYRRVKGVYENSSTVLYGRRYITKNTLKRVNETLRDVIGIEADNNGEFPREISVSSADQLAFLFDQKTYDANASLLESPKLEAFFNDDDTYMLVTIDKDRTTTVQFFIGDSQTVDEDMLAELETLIKHYVHGDETTVNEEQSRFEGDEPLSEVTTPGLYYVTVDNGHKTLSKYELIDVVSTNNDEIVWRGAGETATFHTGKDELVGVYVLSVEDIYERDADGNVILECYDTLDSVYADVLQDRFELLVGRPMTDEDSALITDDVLYDLMDGQTDSVDSELLAIFATSGSQLKHSELVERLRQQAQKVLSREDYIAFVRDIEDLSQKIGQVEDTELVSIIDELLVKPYGLVLENYETEVIDSVDSDAAAQKAAEELNGLTYYVMQRLHDYVGFNVKYEDILQISTEDLYKLKDTLQTLGSEPVLSTRADSFDVAYTEVSEILSKYFTDADINRFLIDSIA